VVASRSLVRSDLPTFLLSSCRVTYPNMVRWFEEQGVEMELSDMSFAVSLDGGKGCEWGSTSLAGLFAQKRNLANPHFYRMLREMVLFQGDVLQYLAGLEAEDATLDQNETLGQFLEARGYSAKFRKCYLLPVCSAIWSCSSQGVLGCSAASILSFLRNHHMLQASSGRTRGHRSNQAPGKDHFAPLAGNDDPLSF
jgi:cyclopropane-fatty-acyl-phospholipid synthase